MLPLLAGAAALLLLSSSSSAKSSARPKLPAPVPRLVSPSAARTAPKSAPKSSSTHRITQAKLKPAPAPRVPTGMSAPLARSASQGGTAPLAAPLSADMLREPAPTQRRAPATQSKAPTPRSQTPGYKPDAARRGAPALVNHLRRKGKAQYDRRMLKTWQTQAGLTADGLYGPATRGALIAFGQKDPPAVFYGTGTTTYTPPR